MAKRLLLVMAGFSAILWSAQTARAASADWEAAWDTKEAVQILEGAADSAAAEVQWGAAPDPNDPLPCEINEHCDDNNACTEDACDGVCYHSPIFCGEVDNNPCTEPVCDAIAGCIEVPVEGPLGCDDGDPCTVSSFCSAGICQPGEPANCDDNNPCTIDSCGGVANIRPIAPCVHEPVVCEDDGNPCTIEVCGEFGCQAVPGNDNAPCEDFDPCSATSACQYGYCMPTSPTNCDDNDPCTTDFCNGGLSTVEAGGCVNEPIICGDNGNVCDGDEQCVGGDCVSVNPPECVESDNNPCTTPGCNPTVGCQEVADDNASCDDGDVCTGISYCDGGDCIGGSPLNCDDNEPCNGAETCDSVDGCQDGPDLNCETEQDTNPCVAHYCQEGVGCVSENVTDNTPCDDGSVCTDNTACQAGVCTGGSTITCDDTDTCTTDSCDAIEGCVFDVTVESPACGSCEDGEDNDEDGDADAEDCSCATLCAQQRFAIVTTFVPSKLTRYALYAGSDVVVNDSIAPLPYPSGGVCQTNGDYRAGIRVGHIAATGSSRFGKAASLDPDLLDEEGDNDIDTGSDRVSYVRQTYDSDGDAYIIKDSAPYVGAGTCSNDAMLSCLGDADCGMGNDCENQLLLDNPMNANVTEDGSGENFDRCVNAQATVQPEADAVALIAGNVTGYTDGTAILKTTASNQTVEVTVGAGQQVVHARRVQISGKTVLRFRRDPMAVGPDTVLVIRIARQLRLGGEAEVQLVGIDPANVLWVAEGPTGGRPKLLRASHFRGTLLAAERKGITVGGEVTIDGALKGRRVKLGQSSVINHVPFKALLQ